MGRVTLISYVAATVAGAMLLELAGFSLLEEEMLLEETGFTLLELAGVTLLELRATLLLDATGASPISGHL
jgi:hypothetical protein